MNELLTVKQLILFGLLLCSAIGLSLLRNNQTHLDPAKTTPGIVLTLEAGAIAAAGFFFFSD